MFSVTIEKSTNTVRNSRLEAVIIKISFSDSLPREQSVIKRQDADFKALLEELSSVERPSNYQRPEVRLDLPQEFIFTKQASIALCQALRTPNCNLTTALLKHLTLSKEVVELLNSLRDDSTPLDKMHHDAVRKIFASANPETVDNLLPTMTFAQLKDLINFIPYLESIKEELQRSNNLIINEDFVQVLITLVNEKLSEELIFSVWQRMFDSLNIKKISITKLSGNTKITGFRNRVIQWLEGHKKSLELISFGEEDKRNIPHIDASFSSLADDHGFLVATMQVARDGYMDSCARIYCGTSTVTDDQLDQIMPVISGVMRVTFCLPQGFHFTALQTLSILGAFKPWIPVESLINYFPSDQNQIRHIVTNLLNGNNAERLIGGAGNRMSENLLKEFISGVLVAMGVPTDKEQELLEGMPYSKSLLNDLIQSYNHFEQLRNNWQQNKSISFDSDSLSMFDDVDLDDSGNTPQVISFRALLKNIILAVLLPYELHELKIDGVWEDGLNNFKCRKLSGELKEIILQIIAVNKNRLRILSVKNSGGFDVGFAAHFFQGLETASSLGSLSLTNLGINSQVTRKLADYVEKNSSLQYLDVSNNQIEQTSLTYLQNSLNQNHYLAYLVLRGTQLTNDAEVINFLTEVKKNHALVEINISSEKFNGNYPDKITQRWVLQDFKKTILDKKNQITTTNKNQGSALLGATSKDDASTVKAKLENGVSAYFADEQGDTVAHHAVKEKAIRVTAFLLNIPGLNRFIANKTGETFDSLYQQADEEFRNKVAAEVEAKKRSQAKDQTPKSVAKSGQPAKAIPKGQLGIQGFLAKRPAASSVESPQQEETSSKVARTTEASPGASIAALQRGSASTDSDIVMQSVVQTNPEPIINAARIYLAVISGDLSYIKKLSSEVVLAIRFAQKNILHLALLHQQADIAACLLEVVPALANEQDEMQCLPLHYACRFCWRNTELLTLLEPLISKTDAVDLKDSFGLTAFYWLILNSNSKSEKQPKEKVKLFLSAVWQMLEKGADPDELMDDPIRGYKMAPLHAAVYAGIGTFKLLWRKTGDRNLLDSKRNTVSHHAALATAPDVFRYITIFPAVKMRELNAQRQRPRDLLLATSDSSRHEPILPILDGYEASGRISNLHNLFWVPSLKVRLGSEHRSKQVTVEADFVHSRLKSSHEAKNTKGNTALFTVTFIIGDGSHRSTTQPWYSTDNLDTLQITTDAFRQRVIARYHAAPNEAKASTNRDLLIPEVIAALPVTGQNGEASLYGKFKHSEQLILNNLENDDYLKEMVAGIMAENEKFRPGTKLYAGLLDVGTTFCICENCRVALLGSLNPEAELFAGKLIKLLQEMGFILPKHRPLPFVVRASAYRAPSQVPMTGVEDIDLRAVDGPIIIETPYEHKEVGATNSRGGTFRK